MPRDFCTPVFLPGSLKHYSFFSGELTSSPLLTPSPSPDAQFRILGPPHCINTPPNRDKRRYFQPLPQNSLCTPLSTACDSRLSKLIVERALWLLGLSKISKTRRGSNSCSSSATSRLFYRLRLIPRSHSPGIVSGMEVPRIPSSQTNPLRASSALQSVLVPVWSLFNRSSKPTLTSFADFVTMISSPNDSNPGPLD